MGPGARQGRFVVASKRAVLSEKRLRKRLLARVRAGKAVTVAAVRADELDLYTAMRRHHASWPKGLRALRIPAKARTEWTPELVLARLRERLTAGLAVTDHALHDSDPPLYGACQRLFGSRERAVEQALAGSRRQR